MLRASFRCRAGLGLRGLQQEHDAPGDPPAVREIQRHLEIGRPFGPLDPLVSDHPADMPRRKAPRKSAEPAPRYDRLRFAGKVGDRFARCLPAMMIEIQAKCLLLSHWKKMPDAPPSEYSPWSAHRDRHNRFSDQEISTMREDLRRRAPLSYYSVFPEERPGADKTKV